MQELIDNAENCSGIGGSGASSDDAAQIAVDCGVKVSLRRGCVKPVGDGEKDLVGQSVEDGHGEATGSDDVLSEGVSQGSGKDNWQRETPIRSRYSSTYVLLTYF